MGANSWETGRFLDDAETRKELVNQMPEVLRDEYLSYKFVSKEAAFPGRVLVVYTLAEGKPTNLEVITLWGLQVALVGGPQASASSEGQGEYQIGAVPTKWRGRDMFVQIPQEFIFKWKGKRSKSGLEFAPHFAILIKTKSRELDQVDGDTYCATLNDFRARFPGVRVAY